MSIIIGIVVALIVLVLLPAIAPIVGVAAIGFLMFGWMDGYGEELYNYLNDAGVHHYISAFISLSIIPSVLLAMSLIMRHIDKKKDETLRKQQ